MTGPDAESMRLHIELQVEPVLMDRELHAWCPDCLLPSAERFTFAVEVAGRPTSWLYLLACHDCETIRRVEP